MIKYDFKTFMDIDGKNNYQNKIHKIKKRLDEKQGFDSFLKRNISEEELEKIKKVSNYVKKNADVFLIIAIGDSYIGSKALIELFKEKCKDIEIRFVGYSLASHNLSKLLEEIKDKRIVVNVISKSGNTMEVNLIFQKILELMKGKYSNKELRKRIIVTTNNKTGDLREIALKNHYTLFKIPKISGRYSILTTVGLLPMCVASINIDALLDGFDKGNNDIDKCFIYAVIRDLLSKEGKKIEALTVYDERLLYFNEWLKHLFGSQLGDNKGILPISVFNTCGMHYLGKSFEEEGIVFNTVINIVNNKDVIINDKSLNKINNLLMLKTAKTTKEASIIINIDKLTEENIGMLLYFFMTSSVIYGYLTGLNPYHQSGNKEYKRIIKESVLGV